MGFSLVNHPFLGTPSLGHPHILEDWWLVTWFYWPKVLKQQTIGPIMTHVVVFPQEARYFIHNLTNQQGYVKCFICGIPDIGIWLSMRGPKSWGECRMLLETQLLSSLKQSWSMLIFLVIEMVLLAVKYIIHLHEPLILTMNACLDSKGKQPRPSVQDAEYLMRKQFTFSFFAIHVTNHLSAGGWTWISPPGWKSGCENRCRTEKWLTSMVYGRYNYSFHGVYKPANITWGHHPVPICLDFTPYIP